MEDVKPPVLPYKSGPFISELGVELLSRADGRSHVRLDVEEWMRNSHGLVHGGVLSTLSDVAAAHAAMSLLVPTGHTVMTVELHSSFLAPTRRGPIEGFGEVVHQGRSLVRARATLRGGSRNAILAESIACFMVFPATDTDAGENPARQL